MSLPDRYVARVIDNSLVAAEGVLFGKKSGGASGHKGDGLVITEAREDGIALERLWSSRTSNLVSSRLRTGSLRKLFPFCIVTRCGQGIEIEQV